MSLRYVDAQQVRAGSTNWMERSQERQSAVQGAQFGGKNSLRLRDIGVSSQAQRGYRPRQGLAQLRGEAQREELFQGAVGALAGLQRLVEQGEGVLHQSQRLDALRPSDRTRDPRAHQDSGLQDRRAEEEREQFTPRRRRLLAGHHPRRTGQDVGREVRPEEIRHREQQLRPGEFQRDDLFVPESRVGRGRRRAPALGVADEAPARRQEAEQGLVRPRHQGREQDRQQQDQLRPQRVFLRRPEHLEFRDSGRRQLGPGVGVGHERLRRGRVRRRGDVPRRQEQDGGVHERDGQGAGGHHHRGEFREEERGRVRRHREFPTGGHRRERVEEYFGELQVAVG